MSTDLDQRIRDLLRDAASTVPPAAGLAARIEDATVRAAALGEPVLDEPVLDEPAPARFRRGQTRWVLALASAAAVAAVGIGVAVAGAGHHPNHGQTATSVPPVPTSPPTQPPTVEPTPTPPPTPTGSVTAPPERPANVRLGTAAGEFTVPSTWAAAAGSPAGSVCLTANGADYAPDGAGNNCELFIRTLQGTSGDSTLAGGVVDPDRPGAVGHADICGSPTNAGVSTTTSDDATVGSYPAEHRVFTGSCISGSLEQWVVPTAPAIVITRWNGAANTAAAAESAVRSAQLAAQRGTMRLVDRGKVLATSGFNGRWTVTIDRVVLAADGRVTNNNAATYTYPEAYQEYPSGLVKIQYYANGSYQDLSPVGLEYLVVKTGFYQTLPPIEDLVAEITTDGNEVTRIVLHLPQAR